MIFKNSRLISGFSKKPLNMSLIYGLGCAEAIKNRKDFLGKFSIDYRSLVCARQSHGSRVVYVGEQDRGKGADSMDNAIHDADAFITDKTNLPLAVFTADCLSVFLYDTDNHAIGLVHAGWRGSRSKITAKAAILMHKKFNAKFSRLQAGFGPAIRACCCEVGREFKDYFVHGVEERNGRFYLDLIQVNREQLLDLGLQEENIFDTGSCTFCKKDDFFSYRRERDRSGRMMSVIMLK